MIKRKPKKPKPPKTGFSKFLEEAWLVLVERCKLHKAMRILSTQQWSVEFLIYLVKTAAKQYGQDIQILIENKTGDKFTITNYNKVDDKKQTEALLDSLDDKARFDVIFANFHNHPSTRML